jgi:nucleoside-diphosphate-sugar epimerase
MAVRILVLGATGRLGGMLRRSWSAPDTVPGLLPLWQARQGRAPQAGEDWVVFDPRTDPLALARACAAVDVVLDLSGPVPGPGRVVDSFAATVPLARAVAHAAQGRPLLWASSSAVYGARPFCVETDPLAPRSDYGRAKAAAEAALTGRPGVCILRIGNVAGADALLSAARPGIPVVLDRFADGTTPLRSYMGPQTLAQSLFQLARRATQQPLPEVLNLAAPGPGVAMADLLDAAALRWRSQVAPDTALPRLVLDTSALAKLVDLPSETGQPAEIVAEWRADEALKQALCKGPEQ